MTTSRTVSAVFAASLAWGCVGSHSLDDDAGVIADGGPRDAAVRDAGVAFTPRPTHPDGSEVVFCGGEACPSGDACCLATLDCHDPSSAGSCPAPPVPEPGGPATCSSSADCAEAAYCAPASVCGGSGVCVPRPSEEGCLARIAEIGGAYCGCDGITYQEPCEAHLHGTTAPWPGACGGPLDDMTFISCDPSDPDTCGSSPGTACVPHEAGPRSGHSCEPVDPLFLCARDEHCGSGDACCEWLGLCLRADRAAACDATIGHIPCDLDEECDLGLGDSVAPMYCAGDGCGGAGRCEPIPRACGGELEPVCGCDGVDYQNPCEAARVRVRVAHTGTCAP